MGKAQEHKRLQRQRRRFRARSAVWLERNSTPHGPGAVEPFEGGYVCHYCEHWFKKKKITKDHIVPRAQGGVDDEFNIVLACRGCNQEKGASWPECPCIYCQTAIVIHKKIKLAQGFQVDLEDVQE